MQRDPAPPQGMQILGPISREYAEILTAEALGFLGRLHRQFDSRRRELLGCRTKETSLCAGW